MLNAYALRDKVYSHEVSWTLSEMLRGFKLVEVEQSKG
jgi:hypothetical protein